MELAHVRDKIRGLCIPASTMAFTSISVRVSPCHAGDADLGSP